MDMIITFKDAKNTRYIRHTSHFVKQGVRYKFHIVVWISTQSTVADGMTKVLTRKDQHIDRDQED
jgi:hypothetical protein